MAARSPAEDLDIGGVAVRLSNPDKIYFPALGAAGGTKRHLVDYDRAVAENGAIITALRDRPTYLQRFPDGIEGEEIYQKRIPAKAPEHVETCRITFPSGRTADALKVRSAPNVVWAAHLGTVTFHPWHARCADVDHPDELRIDL
ncbi:MAG: non-homologous end-joining DNA ligase LigD, partial [Mycobacteriaceae bacterium]